MSSQYTEKLWTRVNVLFGSTSNIYEIEFPTFTTNWNASGIQFSFNLREPTPIKEQTLLSPSPRGCRIILSNDYEDTRTLDLGDNISRIDFCSDDSYARLIISMTYPLSLKQNECVTGKLVSGTAQEESSCFDLDIRDGLWYSQHLLPQTVNKLLNSSFVPPIIKYGNATGKVWTHQAYRVEKLTYSRMGSFRGSLQFSFLEQPVGDPLGNYTLYIAKGKRSPSIRSIMLIAEH